MAGAASSGRGRYRNFGSSSVVAGAGLIPPTHPCKPLPSAPSLRGRPTSLPLLPGDRYASGPRGAGRVVSEFTSASYLASRPFRQPSFDRSVYLPSRERRIRYRPHARPCPHVHPIRPHDSGNRIKCWRVERVSPRAGLLPPRVGGSSVNRALPRARSVAVARRSVSDIGRPRSEGAEGTVEGRVGGIRPAQRPYSAAQRSAARTRSDSDVGRAEPHPLNPRTRHKSQSYASVPGPDEHGHRAARSSPGSPPRGRGGFRRTRPGRSGRVR
jgi:hypothetical protein